MRKLTKEEIRRLSKLASTDDMIDSMRYIMSTSLPIEGENGLERAAKMARTNKALHNLLDSGIKPKTLAKMSIKRKKKDV